MQTKNEKYFAERMAEYYLLIKREYHIPPKQVVLYVGEERLNMSNMLDDEDCKCKFQIIDLSRDIDCNLLLESDKAEDWIMAPLCNFENEDIILKEVIKRLNFLPNRERDDGLIKLTTLLGLRKRLEKKIKKEVDEMPIKVLDHPLYKEGKSDGRKEGIEKKTREDVINLFLKLKTPPNKISEVLNVPLSKVKKILKEEGLIK
jgi:hypothetical protein